MKTYIAQLESLSPYSSSRKHREEKLDKETPEAHEERTWRHKLTTNVDGMVCIPAMAFKFGLTDACRYIGAKIPGKRNATYTKHFEGGLLITEDVNLGIHKDSESVEPRVITVNGICEHYFGKWVYVNADGVRGGGSRVFRCFPTVKSWKAPLTITVLDDTITAELLRNALETMGLYIGVGQFRAQNGGTNGRFKVVSFKEGK